jgi:hypothetical protein
MKNDKSDKNPATSATSATQETALTGLLGGSIDTNDPLALVGLGVGATQRAKDLVLKSLEFERQEELNAFIENELAKLAADETALNERLKSLDKLLGSKSGGKGRPTKGWLTLDVERAAAIIDAASMFFERFNRKISSQEKAIDMAMQIDAILVKHGSRNKRLFRAGISAIRNSVSKGLKEFPEEKDHFIEK